MRTSVIRGIRLGAVAIFITGALLPASFLAQTPPAQSAPALSTTTSKDLWLIVTDKAGNLVRDLKKEDLAIKIGGKPVNDFDLRLDSVPAAFVLAVDNSGSLRMHLDQMIQGSRELFGKNERKNLVVLMRFVSRGNIQITQKFSSDPIYFESNLKMFFIEGGQTALIDAIYKSVQIVSGQTGLKDQYRRAVVVISDGEDRDSENTEKSLRDLLAKENVQVFFVGLTELLSDEAGFIGKGPVKKAKTFIETISRDSGGVALFPKPAAIKDAARTIGALLNDQYALTLRSATPIAPGELIEIEFASSSKRKNVNLHYRSVNN